MSGDGGMKTFRTGSIERFPLRPPLRNWDLALFFCCCLKLVGTFGRDLLCDATPNLTVGQRVLCREVPEAIPVLSDVMETFADECKWQFKTSRWNCTGIRAPIYVGARLEENSHSAFIQALTSAITVHKITERCYNGSLGNYCGRINAESVLYGYRHINQYNITAGKLFAQRFLDDRALQVLSNSSATLGDIIRAQIHLHNNAVGRQVVQNESHTIGICTGVSGSCTTKTYFTYLPSIFEIGDRLKAKQEDALKVVPIVDDNGAISLRLQERRRGGEGEPPATELIYLAAPTNHCQSNPDYTTSRYCLPRANLTVDPPLSQFYAPCEDFCCSGRYQATTKTIPQSCNCYFEFCCNLKCQDCEQTFTEYTCLGEEANNSDRVPP